MTGTYNLALVLLSFVVAIAASFTALQLARRVSTSSGFASRFWLSAGSVSMGIGIWTMHFVGMLAFSMDMPYSYDVPMTILSAAVGVAASAFAIFVGSRRNVSLPQIILSGLILGAGIASMHYTGMAAMKMQAVIVYDTFWLLTSIVIAVVAATAAIWISFTLAHAEGRGLFQLRLLAAIVMGFAICGMHYTGMFAASYQPIPGTVMNHTELADTTWMAVALGISALVILGVTQLTIYFDYRLDAARVLGEKAEREAVNLSQILDESSNEIYVFDSISLKFLKVNNGAVKNLGYSRAELMEMTPLDLKPEFTQEHLMGQLAQLETGTRSEVTIETIHRRADGSTYPVSIHVQHSKLRDRSVYVAMASDVTDRRSLEDQVAQSRKLESIGQLAAGIAHEINTPAQFVGDNIRFLKDGFDDLLLLMESYQELDKAARNDSVDAKLLEKVSAAVETADPEYLVDEIPAAIQQSLDGVVRISKIVLAMKEFSHPGSDSKEMADLNKIIANTIVVASNEWKYIADVTTDYQENLPPVACFPQAISQVILNLIVNGAHAIHEKMGDSSQTKGLLSITTRLREDAVEISITDSGTGVPEEIRKRIFDPFFTTKEVGKGTGQGLSMAFKTIVDGHDGGLVLESTVGQGTTFIITLPLAESKISETEVAA